jgi:hypothetical protein
MLWHGLVPSLDEISAGDGCSAPHHSIEITREQHARAAEPPTAAAEPP